MSTSTPSEPPAATVSVAHAYSIAADHFNAGRLDQAEAIARIILAADPRLADALHLLGVIAFRREQDEQAVRLIGEAIALAPSIPEYYSNRALAQGRLGQRGPAEAGYRRSIELDPAFADAMMNFSRFLCDSGRGVEALQWAAKSVALQPESAAAHNQVGIALQTCGRFRDAEAACRRALSLQPDFPHASNNLAGALHQQGRLDEAAAIFENAIARDSTSPELRVNFASLLRDMDRIDDAIDAFKIGLSLRPDSPEILAALGSTYREQGRIDLAVEHMRRAVDLRPRSLEMRGSLLYVIQYHPDYDAAMLLRAHRAYGELAEALAPAPPATYANPPGRDRPLRVGFVSADFRTHPVGRQILPLFRLRDRERFHYTCYSNVTRPDATTDIFRAAADAFRPITGLGDDRAAELIRADAIDILIDLSLHTAGACLGIFARKPAPVSATFAGYPGSTGLARIDWRISDPHLDPPGTDGDYVERTKRLPASFWCFDPDGDAPPVNDLPAATRGHITFGCLGHPCKVNAGVIALWAEVMKRTAGSRLRLLSTPGVANRHLIDQFATAGISADRIDLLARAPRLDYLREFHAIDIGLDTLPYAGHTTTLDSFWMGAPVVTQIGKTVVGRAGLSQLLNLDLPQLIAETAEDYVRIATELAADVAALAELRKSLRPRMAGSRLCDVHRCTADFETLLRQLWDDRQCAQAAGPR